MLSVLHKVISPFNPSHSHLHMTLGPAHRPLRSSAYTDPTGDSGPGQYLVAPFLMCPQSSSSYSISKEFTKKESIGQIFYYNWFPQQLVQLTDTHFTLRDCTVHYFKSTMLNTLSPWQKTFTNFGRLNSTIETFFCSNTQQISVLLHTSLFFPTQIFGWLAF